MHGTRYVAGLLTLALAAIGLWFLLEAIDGGEGAPGLVLRVEFRDARGLRGGADVRCRGVTVGAVRSVQVSEDGSKALVDVVLDRAGAAQATVDSAFWIVTPRFAGITGGASGLDTLVRDAYVAFVTPEERGSPLHNGSLVVGMEQRPAWFEGESLEAVAHGDLRMTVLVPENHGLRPGSTVVYRGVVTGEVRRVELAAAGTHVEIELRIQRRLRQTVTDKSVFWIARPHVSGALFSGFTVADVSALLVPYIAYHTPAGVGTPVEDGHRCAAAAMRPDIRVEEVPATELTREPPRPKPPEDPLVLVRIVYAAVEEDWLSPDDHVRRAGTGLLYLDRSGRPVVLTARSLVDAGYTERDTLGGNPDVVQEQIKVALPGSSVLRAGRVWVDPEGLDLAVLVLEGTAPDLRGTPPELIDFGPAAAGTAADSLRTLGEDGTPEIAQLAPGAELPAPAGRQGSLLLVGGRVTAVLGQKAGRDEAPAAHALTSVPADLRPGG